MISRVLLVAAFLALAWSASLPSRRDHGLVRVKRHEDLIELANAADAGNVEGPRRNDSEPQPDYDSVNPAMIIDENCDTGQVNLTMDWDEDSAIYTCQKPNTFKPNKNKPVHYCQEETYEPRHICTFEHVPPNPDYLPVSGAHRPVWPQYGEYRYIPPERYLHGLEHGGIALMYHPCADKKELAKLKNVLTGCLWRHIISASDRLDEDYPFALLSWGCALKLGHADIDLAVSFIKMHALQSAEFAVFFDGFFNHTLIEHSKIITDKKDSVICPDYPEISEWLLYTI